MMYKDKNWLYNEYVVLGKSLYEIGKMCGVNRRIVYYWMKKYGIPRRTQEEALSLLNKDAEYKDRDYLYNEYIVLEKSLREIAKNLGTSIYTIWTWLNKYDITIRNPVEGVDVIWKDSKHRDRDWLYEQYVILKKSTKQIEIEFGISASLICRWLKKFDIPTRTRSEALTGKKLSPEHRLKAIANAKFFPSGPEHPNWIDGRSCDYSSEFDDVLKEEVRTRDNYTCQGPECGITQEEAGYTLPVHHIDYDKENSDMINLVTLCCSCHCKTNYNRDEWTEYFSNKLECGGN